MFSRTLIIAGSMLLVTRAAAPVGATTPLPALLQGLLQRFDVPPDNTAGLVLGAIQGKAPTWATDPDAAARMEQARHEDVVAEHGDTLFDDANVRLGLWTSDVFLRDYGTAMLLTAPYDEARIPVFLVHGINGSPRDFAPLVSQFGRSRYQPVVFYYPTGMSLADAARELGIGMQRFLRRHPARSFAVVGHSMGGLVAKGMLDQLDVAREFPAWRAFVGISCPWTGIPAAAHAGRLRVHPHSWDDLAPGSSFVRNVNITPFPPRVAFYMFFGARGGRSIMSVLGNNDGRLTVDSMMDTPLSKMAQDSFGFYEDHVSILGAPRVFDRLEKLLDHELAGSPADRRPRS